MQPDLPRAVPRALRGSAYASFAYAALQMWFLPAFEPASLLRVGLSLAVAVLIWRGSRMAAGVAAAYGAWRLALLIVALVRVLNGTAVEMVNGPAFVVAQVVALPFAIFWVRGGMAVLRERRT